MRTTGRAVSRPRSASARQRRSGSRPAPRPPAYTAGALPRSDAARGHRHAAAAERRPRSVSRSVPLTGRRRRRRRCDVTGPRPSLGLEPAAAEPAAEARQRHRRRVTSVGGAPPRQAGGGEQASPVCRRGRPSRVPGTARYQRRMRDGPARAPRATARPGCQVAVGAHDPRQHGSGHRADRDERQQLRASPCGRRSRPERVDERQRPRRRRRASASPRQIAIADPVRAGGS